MGVIQWSGFFSPWSEHKDKSTWWNFPKHAQNVHLKFQICSFSFLSFKRSVFGITGRTTRLNICGAFHHKGQTSSL